MEVDFEFAAATVDAAPLCAAGATNEVSDLAGDYGEGDENS